MAKAKAIYGDNTTIKVEVIGKRPRHQPYLSIRTSDDVLLGTISNAQSLRALARRILRSLGEEEAKGVRRG